MTIFLYTDFNDMRSFCDQSNVHYYEKVFSVQNFQVTKMRLYGPVHPVYSSLKESNSFV
jgi:hypothetical protein